MKNNDQKYMRIALKQAMKAQSFDEIPIGAVIVKDDKIISYGYNKRETLKNSLGHAEIMAINKACKKLDNWRLNDCVLYVTLEPCIMCAGAIIQSRISKVVFGAFDSKGGAFGSSIDVRNALNINHYVDVQGGILEEECSEIIKKYFKEKRIQKKDK